ncbi:MAG: diguanylate cyclase [Candidatus Calescibacterium sp.]|nr:diguanylate cyclase [Candidatus Calescibacterium sp.]MDW8132582.1 diguanylate cyclase [Candidatus Calescibacterium sp.]
MKKSFNRKMAVFLFFILFFITQSVFSLDFKDLEGKSEQELYNMAENYYKKFDDKSAYIVCAYIIKNVNNRNKNVFYILAEILIRNITASADKQKVYNEILKYSDYIINNIDFYDARAYYYKGWVYYSSGDYASAEFNLKKSIQNNPSFLPSLRLLLDLYIYRKNFEEAIKIADRILDRGYINDEFAYLIFKLYIDSNQISKARDFYVKYSSYLNNEKTYFLIALLNYKEKNYNRALEYIDRVLIKYPDDLDYIKLKVKILHSMKKYGEAYKIISEKLKDTTDEEILVIKKEIESTNFMNVAIVVISIFFIIVIVILGYFYLREQRNKMAKISVENLKKLYQERVSVRADNLDILVNLIYEFFNDYILSFNSKMVIYVSDPRKDNVLYCYLNNISNELPDVIYIFPKYSDWLSDYANTPVHLMSLQSNSSFYEWFGGKNIVLFKKQKLFFMFPALSRGLLQGVIFVQAFNEEEEQKIIQTLRKYKEVISEILEEVANDIISIRFKEASLFDELTRLYNRRFMYQKLEEEIEKATKNNQKLSFVLCDIDNFKKFNDTYGHQVGDEVLRAVAKVFKGASREFFDWPFRYGGEEIGIILPNTPSEKAYEIAERIRNEVSSRRFENVPTIITISLGLATYPDHAKTIDEIIRLADEALYYSKRTGKNKTTIYNDKISSVLDQQSLEKTQNKAADNMKYQAEKKADQQERLNIKIPSFVYSLDQFEEYYLSIKSNYKHVIINIEANINENTDKLVMDIYHNLLLVESMGMSIENDKVVIKILLVERSEQDIQNIIDDISRKYNVRPTITTKV